MREFSELELHELVDQALAAASEAKSLSEPAVTKEPSSKEIHFPQMSYLEIALIEHFHNAMVDKGVDSKIRSEVLSDLKEQLKTTENTKISLEDLRTKIHNCRRCIEAIAKPQKMLGNTVSPKILFVIATIGNNTNKLTDYLEKYEFEKTSCGITFVTRCPFQREVTEAAINNCANYLFAEIDYLQPELIVPVGAIPLRVLAGPAHKLNDSHGRAFWLGPFRLFPIFTPVYAEKSNKQKAFEADLVALKQMAYA